MSDLQAKLQTYYGSASLPILKQPIQLGSPNTLNTLRFINSPYSLCPSKLSHNSLLTQQPKRRCLLHKDTCQPSVATTLTEVSLVLTSLFEDERIKRILRGAKRKLGIRHVQQAKELTEAVLSKIVFTLQNSNTFDDINIRAAFCVAFAAFLRIAEFTWPTWTPQSHLVQLSRGSVVFTANGNVILTLPASKNNSFRRGVEIPLAASHGTICPVFALHLLFSRYPRPLSDPLFCRTLGPFNSN